MKKIIALITSILLCASLAACTQTDAEGGDGATTTEPTVTTAAPETTVAATEPEVTQPSKADPKLPLSELAAKVNELAKSEVRAFDIVPTAENFTYYFGINYIEGSEALVSEAMITSIAHSVGFMRVPEGSDVAAIAKEIKEKVDPRKWICVGAETVHVEYVGNLIFLVMTSNNADGYINAFAELTTVK